MWKLRQVQGRPRTARAGNAEVSDRKYLTEAEVTSLLRVIKSPRDKALFTIMYWRGLRASEAGRLKLSDFDPKKGRLHVKRGKGSLDGSFLLSPPELRALRAWLQERGTDAGPIFLSRNKRGIDRRMVYVLYQRYAKQAAIPKSLHHPHCLKHSIATHLIGKLGTAKTQVWLGHKDVKSTMVYAQIRSAEMDAAAREVYGEL